MMQQLIENCHAAYQRFNELTAALDRGEDVVVAHQDASAALRYALMDVRHVLNVWFDGIEEDDALAQVERVRGALTARQAAARRRENWPFAGYGVAFCCSASPAPSGAPSLSPST
jgi:hypothetical protein